MNIRNRAGCGASLAVLATALLLPVSALAQGAASPAPQTSPEAQSPAAATATSAAAGQTAVQPAGSGGPEPSAAATGAARREAKTAAASPSAAVQPAPAAGAASGPESTNQVQEVVVTAAKREQRLQDVPVTDNVLSGATLKTQGISNITQLQYSVPALTYTAGPSSSYAIRGIGTQTFSRTASSDVSVVLNGVIQGQPRPPANSLFDVQRVEVLSGPQGTLFGKNASAGVINIITNAPDPHAISGSAHADVGNLGYQIYQGVANLPVTEHSALRLSAFSNSESSTLHNTFTGGGVNAFTDYGGRAHFLYSDNGVKLSLIGDYEKDNGDTPEFTGRSLTTLAGPLEAAGVTPGPRNVNVALDGPVGLVVESYGLTGEADVTRDGYTFTSITGERQFISTGNFDPDLLPTNVLNENFTREFDNQLSEELRVTSPSGQRVEYVAGLYFYDFTYTLQQTQAGGFGFSPSPFVLDNPNQHLNEESYAAFGQATFHVYRGLSLIAGGRETRDLLTTDINFTPNPSAGLTLPGVTSLGDVNGKANDTNFSYRLGAEYRFTPDEQVYVTYNRGYKGPAINTPFSGETALSRVNAETPLYLEVGGKASLLQHRLAVQVVGFHDIVKNFQAQVDDTEVTPSVFIFANASRLSSDGVQLDTQARPLPGLSIDGGFLYNHAVYGDFLTACAPAFCTGAFNVKGRQLALAARLSGYLNTAYEHAFTNRLTGFISSNISYRGSVQSTPLPDPNTRIPSFAIVNGQVGMRTADGRYSLAFFARNLFDNRFTSFTFEDLVSGGNNYDQYFSRDAFRILGASLDARF